MSAEARPAKGAAYTLALANLLAAFGTSAANVALPTFGTVFDATFAGVQWIVLGYLLGLTTLLVGVGRLGDLVGHRRLLLVGLALFSVASLASGLAPSLGLLIAARVVQGLGASVMTALSLALVSTAVPKAHAAAAMGLLGTASASGTALGPSLGGVLLATGGWRPMFLVLVPLGAVAFWLARRFVPRDVLPTEAGARFDYAGALLLAIALGAFSLALTLGRPGVGLINFILLFAAVVALGLFVWGESCTAAPLLRLSLLKDAALRASLVANALVATVLMATLVIGPFYLARTLGLSPAAVGLVLSVGPIVAALAGVPAGRFADRFGVNRAVRGGLWGLVLGTLLLALLPPQAGLLGYLLPLVVITGSYALFQTANNAAAMDYAASAQRGLISGLVALSRNLGLIAGASVMATVFAFGSGASDVAPAAPEAVAFGMRLTFGLAAGLTVVALAVTSSFPRAPAERTAGRDR